MDKREIYGKALKRFHEYSDNLSEVFFSTLDVLQVLTRQAENDADYRCLERVHFNFVFAFSFCKKVAFSIFCKICYMYGEYPEICNNFPKPKGLGLLFDESMRYFENYIKEINETLENITNELDIEELRERFYDLQACLDYIVKLEKSAGNIPTSQIKVEEWGEYDPYYEQSYYGYDIQRKEDKFLFQSDLDYHTNHLCFRIYDELEEKKQFACNEYYYVGLFMVNYYCGINDMMRVNYILNKVFSKMWRPDDVQFAIEQCIDADISYITAIQNLCNEIEENHYIEWGEATHELYSTLREGSLRWIEIIDSIK